MPLKIKANDNFWVERRRIASGTVTLDLPFPPSVNNLFFNVDGGGRVATKQYKAWRDLASAEILLQRPHCIVGPVEIALTFIEKSGRHDLDNLVKPILDLLVSSGIIDGDHSKIVRRFSAAWGDVAGARVEIKRAPEWTVRRDLAARAA